MDTRPGSPRAAAGSSPAPLPRDLFFPVGRGEAAAAQAEEAKAVCATCAVRVDCLRWANATRQPHGIYGGMTEDERRALRRREADPTLAAGR